MLAVKASPFSNIALALIKAASFFIVNSWRSRPIWVSRLSPSAFPCFFITPSERWLADTFHNYGYGKIENVTEAVEGVILIGLSLSMSFMAEAMHLVRPGGRSGYSGDRADGFLLGMAINFGVRGSSCGWEESTPLPALRAEGLHFRLEGFISASVALSFVLVILLRKAGLAAAARYVDPSATLIKVSSSYRRRPSGFSGVVLRRTADASIEEAGQMEHCESPGPPFRRVYCDFANIRTWTARAVEVRSST